MKLVILDRDGVINEDSDNYVKTADEWYPIKGSLEAIAKLNHFGYKVVVATNQSGIARGLFSIDQLNSIHHKLHQQLDLFGGHIEFLVFCPHGPLDNCNCRKPKAGMLLQIEERLSVSLNNIPFIGDSKRDIDAAREVGARPILVKTGKGTLTLNQYSNELLEVAIEKDLSAAVDTILVNDMA